jgi:hypothetical protein
MHPCFRRREFYKAQNRIDVSCATSSLRTSGKSCRETEEIVSSDSRLPTGRQRYKGAIRVGFAWSPGILQNDVEILSIHDDIATEQILFSVKGTPKKGAAPFLFKGRTMLILVRYDKSPTGWATLREIVQPALEGQ